MTFLFVETALPCTHWVTENNMPMFARNGCDKKRKFFFDKKDRLKGPENKNLEKNKKVKSIKIINIKKEK